MKAFITINFLAVWFVYIAVSVNGMTQCSLKIPVPDLSYCEAIGSLEEHVDADVHETKGRVKAVQDYQMDSFKLLDQQINLVLKESTSTDEDIKDVAEEIHTIKRFVNNLQPNDEMPEMSGWRQKRAAPSTPGPSQQLLNNAKASFQQSVASVLQKLQSISSSIAGEVTQNTAVHQQLLQELFTNQKALVSAEQQLQSLDTAIRNALNSTGPGGQGVSLSAVTQDVTQLIINGTVAEQVIQRQLDDLDKVVKQMETNEQRTATKIATLTTDLNDLDKRLTNETKQTATLQGAQRQYEDRVDAFLYNTTRNVANLQADIASAKQSVSQVGRTVFNTTILVGKFGVDLKAFRRSVDSVQSVVTFSQPAQQAQTAEILQLKKTLTDDVNVLKYAFGLTTTPP